MKTTDLVRKSIVISGRAAIRAAIDAGENLKYQYYDLMNDRTSLNDAVSLEEQCQILKLTKSNVRNLWTRVRKWASNETLSTIFCKARYPRQRRNHQDMDDLQYRKCKRVPALCNCQKGPQYKGHA